MFFFVSSGDSEAEGNFSNRDSHFAQEDNSERGLGIDLNEPPGNFISMCTLLNNHLQLFILKIYIKLF